MEIQTLDADSDTPDKPAPRVYPPVPPPLPSQGGPQPDEYVLETPEEAPWRLWGALLALVVAADIGLFRGGMDAPGAGIAFVALGLASLAAWVSRGGGRVAAGGAVVLVSLVATLLEPGLANTVALISGIGLLAWVDRTEDVARGFLRVPKRMLLSIPFLLVCIEPTAKALLRQRRVGGLGRALKLILPAVSVSLFFLVLLSWGNAVLGQWALDALGALRGWFEHIALPERARVVLWLATLACGALFLVPALACGKKSSAGGDTLWKQRWEGWPEMQCRLILAGVNIVFLLTNTLDVVYLWIRQSPPQGVSTTDYLYSGVYWLIATTLLAGGLLAVMFNGGESLTRSRWLRGLGMAWVAQNAFLIAGVGFRLWLQVERYCLSPRRVGVAFFLALVLAGFALLSMYMLRGKTLRWLVVRNVAAIFALCLAVQFMDVNRWCADSAAERIASNAQAIELDDNFLSSVGLAGWRVVWALSESDAKTPGAETARRSVEKLRYKLSAAQPKPGWRTWSWNASRETRTLCEILERTGKETCARDAWFQTIEEMYAPKRRR